MTRRPYAYVDIESTRADHAKRIWELAVIVDQPNGQTVEREWLIESSSLDLGNADPKALEVGGFYDRHPQAVRGFIHTGDLYSEYVALADFERLTRRAVLFANNTPFDVGAFDARMVANNLCPSRHYKPKDVIDMAHGWLLGRGIEVPEKDDGTWSSEAISLACGVDPAGYDRHAALGDCAWIRDLHRAITGGSS